MAVTLEGWAQRDQQIESQADRSTLALMKHRWEAIHKHGFSIKEFARAIGRSQRLVQIYVKAYELHQEDEELLVPDLLEKARMDADTFTAAKAIADAEGVGVAHVRQSRMPEVRRVREAIAEVPPERKQERAEKLVRTARIGQVARKEAKASRRANKMQSYIDLEFELEKAKKALTNALVVASDAPHVTADMQDHLRSMLDQCRSMLEMISNALIDGIAVDWDAEMAKLSESES